MLLLAGKLRVQATLNQAKDHASSSLQGKCWKELAPFWSWRSLPAISLAAQPFTLTIIIRHSQLPRLNRLRLHRLLHLNQPLRPEHLTGERYVFLIVVACLWTPRVGPTPSRS